MSMHQSEIFDIVLIIDGLSDLQNHYCHSLGIATIAVDLNPESSLDGSS